MDGEDKADKPEKERSRSRSYERKSSRKDKKRSRSRDRDRRKRSRSRDRDRRSRRSRSRSRERRKRSPTPKSPEEKSEESSSDEDSVLSSWSRRYGPSKNDPVIKLKGDTMIALVTDAKKKHIRGKYGAWHEYLQYLHRHGKGARPPPGNEVSHHTKKTQMTFLKSLRRCDRKGDVELVLEVEKSMLATQPRRPEGITMPNSFINLPAPVPAGSIAAIDPKTGMPMMNAGMPVNMAPTHASMMAAAKPSQADLAAQFGLNESALEALKDPAVRAALDPQVLAALGPVLQTL